MNSNELSSKAAEELLQRRRARSNLLAWVGVCGFEPAAHHVLICNTLQALADGTLGKDKVMIFLPPGSAKSTYTSVLFPPWYLGHNPGKNILACSHNIDLAESFGGKSRNLVEQHSKILGCGLKQTSKAAGKWTTTTEGLFFCAGVGSGIAGHRADLGLIDDPIGKKEDADSKLVRDKQWDWYTYDFKPRLKPGAKQVIIQTRWHEQDLSGRLLENEPDEWHVIRLPFFAEENDPLGRKVGEILWPQWFTADMYPKDVDAGQALYQNNPTPQAGNYFDAEGLVTYKRRDLPPLEQLRIYIGADYAVTKNQRNDATCFVIAGLDHSNRIWVVDWFLDRIKTDEAVEKTIDLSHQYRPLLWAGEKGQIAHAIGPFLTQRQRDRGIFVPIHELASKSDKEVRAQPIKARVRQKTVLFPEDHPQWGQVKHQLLGFPKGTHDDFVDALANIGRVLDQMVEPNSPQVPDPTTMEGPKLTMKWLKDSHNRLERHKKHMRRLGFAAN